MKSRRRIASPQDYSSELQQGFGINGMGQRDLFAARQFPAAHVRYGSKADIRLSPINVRFTPKSGRPHADAATLFLFSPDDHCPIDSAAVLGMCDADPLRPVQQQIGAMHSRIGPLL